MVGSDMSLWGKLMVVENKMVGRRGFCIPGDVRSLLSKFRRIRYNLLAKFHPPLMSIISQGSTFLRLRAPDGFTVLAFN